jgi:Zn-dependent M28 family amino/carboxypeptidase
MIALISLFKEDRKFEKIHDIFGVIKGSEEPDRYVILGNHRDTWTYGAVDPNSGTASLLDIARRLGINTIRCYWINVRHITKSRPRYTLNIRQLSHVYCLNHICH